MLSLSSEKITTVVMNITAVLLNTLLNLQELPYELMLEYVTLYRRGEMAEWLKALPC